jgi:DNA topoisomerase VI subunit A
LNGEALRTPAGTYLVVTPEVAGRVSCERLLFVENLETFRQLERYDWIDYQGKSVLVIYRGDSALSTGEALEVLRARSEPIWAFVDFDPAGLVIANSLPAGRLERIVLPEEAWLRKAANTSRGRQLFGEQEQGARPSLERATPPDVQRAWAVLAELRSAVTQERMLSVHEGN